MALTCSNCGEKVELSDKQRRQLEGKLFACPQCGIAKKLPPLDEPKKKPTTIEVEREFRPPTTTATKPIEPEVAAFLEGIPGSSQPPPRAKPVLTRWERIPWPKKAIFVVTILWLCAVFLFGVLAFFGEFLNYRTEGDLFWHKTEFRYYTSGAVISSAIIAGVCGGIILPTIAYTLTIIPLLAAWFCFKDTFPSDPRVKTL